MVDGGDAGAHIAAGGVPVDICAHEVLGGCHGLQVINAEELQLAVEVLKASQDDVLALG